MEGVVGSGGGVDGGDRMCVCGGCSGCFMMGVGLG